MYSFMLVVGTYYLHVVCNCVLTDPLTITICDLMECMFTWNILVYISFPILAFKSPKIITVSCFGNFVADYLHIFIELSFPSSVFSSVGACALIIDKLLNLPLIRNLHILSLYISKLSMLFLISFESWIQFQVGCFFSRLQLL